MTTRPLRILHTADWHLNDRLGRIERQPDIVARLAEIASILAEHEVDVLLVAGDFLSHYSRGEALRDALADVGRVFRPFLLRGGTMVVLSGNHDHEVTFAMLRSALDLVGPIAADVPGPRPAGRLYLVGQATHLLLDGGGQQPVQFVLLPYPTPARYLFDEATAYRSMEERNRLLQRALVRRLDIIHRDHVRPELPAVLAAHVHVRGSELHSLYHLTETEDVIFEPSDLPIGWAYVALGHIHKPQALPGTSRVRYAGSVERFDFAERHDDKGAVLVEVGPSGLVGEPIVLPLDATPIYDVAIADPVVELPHLAEQFPDRGRALVRYALTLMPGEHNQDALCRAVETVFPRWYDRRVQVAGQEVIPTSAGPGGSLWDVRGTVRAYLDERLRDHVDRSEVVSLADRYLDELEAAG